MLDLVVAGYVRRDGPGESFQGLPNVVAVAAVGDQEGAAMGSVNRASCHSGEVSR